MIFPTKPQAEIPMSIRARWFGRGAMLRVALILMLAAGGAFAQEPAGFRDALGLLDAWVGNRVAGRNQPGLSIGVVLGDHLVWSRGYGWADLEKKTPATPRTLFRIGSITKTFTAVAIMQLRDAGKLQLDDPLGRHLSDVHIQRKSPGTPDVTLRELLTHTAGIQRDIPGTVWTDGIFSTASDMDGPLEQTYEPATQWQYSNLGFALLGKVVAAESREHWDAYVETHILRPLGMTSTRPLPGFDEPGLATGYIRTAPGGAFEPAVKMPNGPIAPAGAMASNVEDLAKYLAFHMAEGRDGNSPVLSGRTLHEMHRVQWLLPDWQNAWGLGMAIRHFDGYVRVGHGGSVPGQRTNIQFYPALRLGVIVLINTDEIDPVSYVEYALQLLAPVVAKSQAPKIPPLSEESRRFVGTYRAQNHAIQLVTILDGQLSVVSPDDLNPYGGRTILEATDQPRVFIMRSGGAFSAQQFGEKLTFDVSTDGTVAGFHTTSARFTRVGP